MWPDVTCDMHALAVLKTRPWHLNSAQRHIFGLVTAAVDVPAAETLAPEALVALVLIVLVLAAIVPTAEEIAVLS